MTALAWLCLGSGIGLTLTGAAAAAAWDRDPHQEFGGSVTIGVLVASGLTLAALTPFVALFTGGLR
jgi:hypothetical protein